MIGSGEAESRAIAGAVRDAIGQARLDAGVNLTGLLAEIDSADSVDHRQLFMCWHLTRTLRPSLSEKLSPGMLRSVLDREGSPSRTVSAHGEADRMMGDPPDPGTATRYGEIRVAPTADAEGDGGVGTADRRDFIEPAIDLRDILSSERDNQSDELERGWLSDGMSKASYRELCRAGQCDRT